MKIYVVRQTIDWQDGTWSSPSDILGTKTEEKAREICKSIQIRENNRHGKYKLIAFYEKLEII